MEEQKSLETIGIGTKEQTQLKPAKVKIVKTQVQAVGTKGAQKVVCEVSHPDKTDSTIQISSAKVEIKNNLKVSGLWINLDEDKLIKKNSALAIFLQKTESSNIKELEGKEIDTIEDESGYLAFKAY